ncbi:FHA domain-containing protein [Rothia sp. ARF10]|nr:FHA domain-containing protein [Rothia sp. ARF10]
MSSTEVTTRTPAGWVALSAGDRHLLVQGSAAFADDLRGPLEAGVVEVLDALSRDGLRALPDFALADTSGEQARVVVRGEAVVRADGDDVTADARMPWRDLDVAASSLELAGPGGRGGWRRPRRLGRPVAAAASEPAPAPEPGNEPEPESEPDAQPDGQPDAEPEAQRQDEAGPPPVPPADLTLPPSEEYAGAAPAERVAPEPAPQPEKKVLIDSVPWRTLPEGDRAQEPAAEPASQPAGAPTPPPADLPAPPPPGQPVPDAADGPTGPDNWGLTGPSPMAAEPAAPASAPETAASSEPPAALDQPAASAPPAPEVTMDRSALGPAVDGPADSPIVLAVICPAGHHSSPHASSCRVCGRDIPTQQPFQTPRPQLGVLRVSTGGLVPLDRGVLLGRSPKVNADLPPSSRPHLVRLASRDNDISRNHAEVILEGWHVLVRDLGSTNGTTVTLPGQEPVRLRPTEDFGIEPGAVLTLADEVSLTYEVSE